MLFVLEVGDVYNDSQYKLVDDSSGRNIEESLNEYADSVVYQLVNSTDKTYLSLEKVSRIQTIIRYYHKLMRKTVTVYICAIV